MASEQYPTIPRRKKPIPMPTYGDMPSSGDMEATGSGAPIGRGVGMLYGAGLGAAASVIPALTPFAPWLIAGGALGGGELGSAIGGMAGLEAEARYAADVAAQDRMYAEQQWNYLQKRHESEYGDAQRNWHLNQVSQYHTPDPARFNLPWGPMGRG